MFESIFKEVTFTPQVFNKHNIYPDSQKLEEAWKANDPQKVTKLIEESSKTFEKLLVALRNLSTSGIFINAFSNWFEEFYKYINEYDQDKQDELRSMMNFLESRGRIVSAQTNKSNQNDEESWIAEASRLNKTREFDLLVASKNSAHTIQINSMDSDFLIYEGATVRPQSEEFMRSVLAPILGYAESVKVIDPYFNPTIPRFANALDIICQTLGNHHSVKESAVIDIYTSVKVLLEKNGMVNWDRIISWPELIDNFEKKHHHTIALHIWEDKINDQWHDRWIVTNQCGITLGSGSDIKKWTDATWGLLDWNLIPTIERKFLTSRNEFNHIAVIDSKGIQKDKPLNQYSDSVTVGKIKRILHDNEKGKVGFLSYKDEDYYFSLPAHYENIEHIKVGCDVAFLPQSGTDRKRAKILSHEVKHEI